METNDHLYNKITKSRYIIADLLEILDKERNIDVSKLIEKYNLVDGNNSDLFIIYFRRKHKDNCFESEITETY